MTITIIPNTPPTFTTAPLPQIVIPGFVKTYNLPTAVDVDTDAITVSLLSGAPSYITYSSGTNLITMSPLIT